MRYPHRYSRRLNEEILSVDELYDMVDTASIDVLKRILEAHDHEVISITDKKFDDILKAMINRKGKANGYHMLTYFYKEFNNYNDIDFRHYYIIREGDEIPGFFIHVDSERDAYKFAVESIFDNYDDDDELLAIAESWFD